MKQAILVIDVQRALFDSAPPPYESNAVIARINAMCARGRAANVPVIWIQHENQQTLTWGCNGWKLQSALVTTCDDMLVRKRTPDAFHHTNLNDLLQQQSIERVVIAGYASEFCVDTTVRRAAALGYEVVIAADAHTTHDKAHASAAFIREHHNTTLASISSFGRKISTLPSNKVSF